MSDEFKCKYVWKCVGWTFLTTVLACALVNSVILTTKWAILCSVLEGIISGAFSGLKTFFILLMMPGDSKEDDDYFDEDKKK